MTNKKSRNKRKIFKYTVRIPRCGDSVGENFTVNVWLLKLVQSFWHHERRTRGSKFSLNPTCTKVHFTLYLAVSVETANANECNEIAKELVEWKRTICLPYPSLFSSLIAIFLPMKDTIFFLAIEEIRNYITSHSRDLSCFYGISEK